MTWAAQLVGCSPSFILDFSASINPLGPPQEALAAIGESFDDLRTYPSPGYETLRQALGQHHAIDPDWIMPGNGAAELLTWIGRDLANCDRTYLLTPAFGDYHRALTSFDARLELCPMDLAVLKSRSGHEPITISQSASLQTLPLQLPPPPASTSGILLNNPHNPTGALWSAQRLEACCEVFDWVVVDEAFMDFLRPEHQQSLIHRVSDYPNLIVVRSLTKFYSLPGLRIGYAIAHPDHLRRWQQWRDPWPVNVLAERAAIAVLQDTEFQHRTWDWLEAARPMLWQGLAKIPGLHPYPAAANFILVEAEGSTTALQQRLLETDRLLIRDCMSFPELGDRHFRVAVRTEAENQRLLQALSQVL